MRLILVGDAPGIAQLLRHVPAGNVVAMVGAAIRTQYLPDLEGMAAKLGVPLLIQPKWGAREYPGFVRAIGALKADLLWVNSYSMILRDDVLASVGLGGLNIHAALLPRNRGCNPIQWAIIHGEPETGVTLHEISPGVDEGPIVDQRKVPIDVEDSWLMVRDRIAGVTDELIVANLPRILSGRWSAVPQDSARATYGRRRMPEDGKFDWSMPVIAIHDQIRALLPPLPPAFYVDRDGKQVPMTEQLSPSGVTALKYGEPGGGVMHSEQVRLRPLRHADAPLLHEWITDRELVILNSAFHPVSEADHEAWVTSMMAKRPDLVIFVIEERSTAAAIGTCQLLDINWRHRSAELQIRIGDTACRGRGLGTEAVRLLCEFGFADLNLHRIYLHVFATNDRAIAAYVKAGFVREGLLRQAAHIDGQWVDVVPMGLILEHE